MEVQTRVRPVIELFKEEFLRAQLGAYGYPWNQRFQELGYHGVGIHQTKLKEIIRLRLAAEPGSIETWSGSVLSDYDQVHDLVPIILYDGSSKHNIPGTALCYFGPMEPLQICGWTIWFDYEEAAVMFALKWS